MRFKKQAFTLVELIVVITILAILGTISFLSFQGYSKDSRNSVRFNDLKLIESSLELYSQKTGFYPESTLAVTITFANAEAWTQGIFGEDTFGSVGKLDHLPLDPLTGTEYTYSLLNTKGEYELAAALEGVVATNESIIDKTYAGTLEGTSLVLGTYNGYMLSVSTGGLDYIIALPTIISGDTNYSSVDDTIFYGKLAYNGSNVLPGNYKGTEFNTNTTFDYRPTALEMLLFTGALEDLKSDQDKRKLLLGKLQNAFSGTVLEANVDYKSLMEGDSEDLRLSKNILDMSLDLDMKLIIENENCNTILYSGGSNGDGVYSINPTGTSTGTFNAYCDMSTGGGGWTLIGRGREDWGWTNSGKNILSVFSGIGTELAFVPAYYSSNEIDNIILSTDIKNLIDGVRLKRATNTSGTSYQEIRWYFTSQTSWDWIFTTSKALSNVIINGNDMLAGNTRDYYGNPAINGITRVFTRGWGSHSLKEGFSYGSQVSDGTNSGTNFLWENSNESHSIPYTEVYIRK